MKKQSRFSTDLDIAVTYIVANKKHTFVAALGITVGITISIFMNSMGSGFTKKSNSMIFNNAPHIRVYKNDEISRPLLKPKDSGLLFLISNPSIVPKSSHIVNPKKIIELLKAQPEVAIATSEIAVKVFYNSGMSQISGDASGVNIEEANKMYGIKHAMVEGKMENLQIYPNGILLGVDIASKMNVRTGDNISITSSINNTATMKVVGLFKTRNTMVDKTKSYISINAAQQLLGEGTSYATNINVNIHDFEKAEAYAPRLSNLTGYKAEDWKEANSSQLSGFKMRGIIIASMGFSILLVSGFGMYNILNITISQRINDIAILKAIGFQSGNVVRIFIFQGLLIGLTGIIAGLILAFLLVYATSKLYLGDDTGYFPIVLDTHIFIRGSFFGLAIAFFASYVPAKKTAGVDPVSIFRK